MEKPKLNLDGSWIKQLIDWFMYRMKARRPLGCTIGSVSRACFEIAVQLTDKSSSKLEKCEEITVRQVTNLTREQILRLPGVGPATMRIIDAFLADYNLNFNTPQGP